MKPEEFCHVQDQTLRVKTSDLAVIMGVTKMTIYNWRVGRYPVPGPAALAMKLLTAVSPVDGLVNYTVRQDQPKISATESDNQLIPQ